MGASEVTCMACNKTHRYRYDEVQNIGTEWHPILLVQCPDCGHKMTLDLGNLDFWDQPAPPKSKDAAQRAKSSDIREYWIQMYVKENHKKLGFSHLEGPFESGPDFRGVYRNRNAVIEVERDCQSFIQHGHHLDAAFSKVNVLVVLTPSNPPSEMKKKLPKNIVYIDIPDFVEWFRPKAKRYADTKRIQRIIDLIASEFQGRYVSQCQEKERDMSTCPDCDLCAYFGEGIGSEASPLFHEMALNFIILYKHPITSDNFKLSEIDPSDIDDFWSSALST
jgi:hypothetical protein